MNIDDLTIGEAKQLVAMFGDKPSADTEFPIGKPFLIRTVTHIVTGKLVAVSASEFTLIDAAWIADTGR